MHSPRSEVAPPARPEPARPARPSGAPHRYEILRPLGHGSFGVVYLARYRGPEGFTRLIALKVLRQDLEMPEDVAQRTRDEARILGMVRHRAIVQVDRMLTLGGRFAIAMEYVEGASLARLLHAGPMAPRHALEIASEIASALHAGYHARGPEGEPLRLLHRDIKPSNVLLTAGGEVKVLDLGIARADFLAREAKTHDLYLGSPGYMAPERLLRVERPEGDVYSLGVVLWEMLARARLGRCCALAEAHQERVSGAVHSLQRQVPAMDAELSALLTEMLCHDPTRRPTAREVERRCLAIAAKMPGEPLRFWAEEAVPPLRGASSPTDPLGWCGQQLSELPPRAPAQPSPPRPARRAFAPEDAPTELMPRVLEPARPPLPLGKILAFVGLLLGGAALTTGLARALLSVSWGHLP